MQHGFGELNLLRRRATVGAVHRCVCRAGECVARGANAMLNPVNSRCSETSNEPQLNILRCIRRIFKRSSDRHESINVIDHVIIDGSGDWRHQKLAEAAQKYGRPFKCAGDDLPHETIIKSSGRR
jgi:hypothetical protein